MKLLCLEKLSKYKKKIILSILALTCAFSITSFSTDKFSFQKTSSFIEPLLRYFLPSLSESTIYTINLSIRKSAHFTEYGLLALLLFAVAASGERAWKRRWLLYAFVPVAILALVDEYMQTFTVTRRGSLSDSLIDILGAVSALTTVWLLRRRLFVKKPH
ncbi:MAG: VanZ family protein [Blastocatellia bacterium]|nr:VanZ family protein [Blastocatellia bacterium]